MKWIKLEAADLSKFKEYESILVSSCMYDEYPYDIVQHGTLDNGEDFWHSYLHIHKNQYEYSSEELLEYFTHYLPLVQPVPDTPK